jgi:phosphatidylglycerophosphate synthase
VFDIALRRVVDPILGQVAPLIANAGIRANQLTIAGAVIGIGAGTAIAYQAYSLALALVILNRIVDGLDGMVARIHGATPWGGYLDSVADFVFYAAVPVGFGLAQEGNLLSALLLTASFILTGVSFLAFAAIAAQYDIKQESQQKAFYYARGIIEGGETIAFFVIMCALPHLFAPLASILTGLCIVSVLHRLWLARRTLI